MDIAVIGLTAALAGSVGILIGGVLRGAKADEQRVTIANLHDTLVTRDEDIEHLAAKCVDLRRRIMRLEPLAERGRRAIEQHRKATQAGLAAQAAKRAAKAAGSVASIAPPIRITAPKKPTRKSALAG